MKSFFIIDKLAKGGAPTHILKLLPQMKKMGSEVRLFCISDDGGLGGSLIEDGIEVNCLCIKKLLSIDGIKKIFQLSKSIRRETARDEKVLIACYLISSCIAGIMLKVLCRKIKLVIAWRDTGYWLSGKYLWAMKLVSTIADGITVNSDAVEKAVEKIIPDLSVPVYKIYNGVSLPDKCREKGFNFRDNNPELDLKKDKAIIGMLCRFCPEKGHSLLLEAARRMIDNGFEINIMLGGDGEYESVIKDLCNKLDLNNYVKFCGRIDNTGTFFDSIDILAAPSLSEGFSNTVLEAMSYGIPVVGSEVGGIPEQVFDNETGLLFECGNVEKLYNALVALVKDKEKREQLGTNARTVVEERFTVDKMAENMIEAFEKICN